MEIKILWFVCFCSGGFFFLFVCFIFFPSIKFFSFKKFIGALRGKKKPKCKIKFQDFGKREMRRKTNTKNKQFKNSPFSRTTQKSVCEEVGWSSAKFINLDNNRSHRIGCPGH